MDNKLLLSTVIPSSVWDSSKDTYENEDASAHVFIYMNVIWAFLSTTTTGDVCRLKFPNLSKVAKLVLILSHSNAGEERVFSLVRLKTPYRSSLGHDGTSSFKYPYCEVK